MKLRIAEDLALPSTAVTQTFGILAVRGAGKSNTAAVMAEEMFDAGLPFVVIDPVGSWFGLRSSADGKAPGLPIPIFGGKHGDLPLERGAGELLADLVVGKRLSCVLDLTTLESEAAKKDFLLAFARRLYLKNEDPLHLFLEEADDYIPQKPMRDEAQLLRAWENIVRRGRARGLGITLITQRSAAISKMVLTQIETLFAMRTTSPQDRAAIEAWVKYHQVGDEVLESLAALKNGEAWVWSPHFLGVMKRVQVRRRRTFDSGATPVNLRGDKAKRAATLADVDLEAVKSQMAATIEKAKAEDPRELRRQIAELKAQISKVSKSSIRPECLTTPKVVEKCVLKDGQLARAEKLLERMDAATVKFSEFEEDLRVTAKEIRDAIASTQNTHATTQQRVSAPTGAYRSAVAADHSPGRGAVPAATASRPAPRVSTGPGVEMKGMHRAMLTALAQHPDGLSKKKILIHTGYASSGPVSTAFADLVREGWAVSTGNGLAITDDGLKALGSYEPLPVGDELREWLLAGDKLSTMEKALLKAVCGAHPHSIRKGEVLERTGYASSGPVSSAFAKLVGLGYVTSQGPSVLKATDELFS